MASTKDSCGRQSPEPPSGCLAVDLPRPALPASSAVGCGRDPAVCYFQEEGKPRVECSWEGVPFVTYFIPTLEIS